MNSQLDWLVHETKLSGDKLPKTIIFCNTFNDIASVVNVLLLILGSHAYIPVGSNDSNDFIVGIFHSASWPNYKEKLLNDFKMLSSKKRIIVASSALSMGVDFP
jgi:superfamily II DNA/RNA helicase